MKVEAIKMAKKEAKKELKKYEKLLETRKDKYLKQLKDAYHYLSKGKKIIDIYEVFKATGVNENEEPKLAIAPASSDEIYFCKMTHGKGVFSDRRPPRNYWGERPAKGLPPRYNVVLPRGTFPDWSREGSVINARVIKTSVPIIPAQFVPEGSLSDYYLLWEAVGWEEVSIPPRDPILLKRLSKNLFAVLAAYELTKLERAIMKGK
jgi:hypothetical protein